MEEYQRITGLPLDEPYAKVAIGHLRLPFMKMTGLRRTVVLNEITSTHVVSMDFLIDHFRVVDSFALHRGDLPSWRSIGGLPRLMFC